jgi:hypothetical protein
VVPPLEVGGRRSAARWANVNSGRGPNAAPVLRRPRLEMENSTATGGKSSLWRSASIGLLFSAFSMMLQVRNGRGFELASDAHTASVDTIITLIIRVLTAPLIFVLIAIVRNLLNGRQKESSASALSGALSFAMLLAFILGGVVLYGSVFFSSHEAISGQARSAFVADRFRLCVQQQRSFTNDATEAELGKYCTCVSEKTADGTTYRQLGRASALTSQKKAEAAGLACALAGN